MSARPQSASNNAMEGCITVVSERWPLTIPITRWSPTGFGGPFGSGSGWPYTNVSTGRCSGLWSVTAPLFKLPLLGKPRHPIPRQGCCCRCCYRPDVPRHSPLVRLPNLSAQLRSPGRPNGRGFSFSPPLNVANRSKTFTGRCYQATTSFLWKKHPPLRSLCTS
jgi:hypothetical protein